MEQFIPFLALLIGGGGVAGVVVALLKVRPEAGQIVVSAAQGAVVIQEGVLETLREENQRLESKLDEATKLIRRMEKKLAEMETLDEKFARCEAELGKTRAHRDQLAAENSAHLQTIRELRKQLGE